MQSHALGVVHVVTELEDLARFLTEALGFPVVECGPDSFLLDNGSVSIRLVRATQSMPRAVAPLVIDVAAVELGASVREFIEDRRLTASEEFWLTPTRKVVRLQTPWTLELLVGRDFNEDELGVVGDLPTELVWEKNAIDAVQTLASFVPVAFRKQVREKTVARAEELAVLAGHLEVDSRTALGALIQITPQFQLETLRERLRLSGFDPSLFERDFSR